MFTLDFVDSEKFYWWNTSKCPDLGEFNHGSASLLSGHTSLWGSFWRHWNTVICGIVVCSHWSQWTWHFRSLRRNISNSFFRKSLPTTPPFKQRQHINPQVVWFTFAVFLHHAQKNLIKCFICKLVVLLQIFPDEIFCYIAPMISYHYVALSVHFQMYSAYLAHSVM